MIRVSVDPANPGQFFACCGLLELADRWWHGAEGWFEKGSFCFRPLESVKDATSEGFFYQLTSCRLTNTMTADQLDRLKELSEMKKSQREKTLGLEKEKKSLEKHRREDPILLGEPFHLRLDWFHDDLGGGSRFKTWAGQQSVFEIASGMKRAIAISDWRTRPPETWLAQTTNAFGLPFNFDADLGSQGSALDVGFSFDPLNCSDVTRIKSTARPCLEWLAFVGLQRFRPRQIAKDNRYLYGTWMEPLSPAIAAPAACGLLTMAGATFFEFRLLYRTKYLKSFLPAIPYSGGFDE